MKYASRRLQTSYFEWEIENHAYTAQKMKFFIKDFFSKFDQIRSFLRIWSHLVKKSLMENFIFCAVLQVTWETWTLLLTFQFNFALFKMKIKYFGGCADLHRIYTVTRTKEYLDLPDFS